MPYQINSDDPTIDRYVFVPRENGKWTDGIQRGDVIHAQPGTRLFTSLPIYTELPSNWREEE